MNNIAIIGAGPSALFAAKTILESSQNLIVHIYERGNAPGNRICPMQTSCCKMCTYCNIINGGGGSGLFSDGKLILDLVSGGKAQGINGLPLEEQEAITSTIKKTFERFDGVSESMEVPSIEEQAIYNNILEQNDLKIKYYSVMHMGTSNLYRITQNFINYLADTFENRVKFNFKTNVTNVIKKADGEYLLVTNQGSESYLAVVAAVGKAGANWLKMILQKFQCSYLTHDYFFGVRLETQSHNIENLLKFSFDPKIYRMVNERKVKLHCVCRNGDIRFYNYNGILSVGGHSPYTKNNLKFSQMDRANFNVMLSFDKTKVPPNDLLAKLNCISGQRILAQRLGDFIANRKTDTWGQLVPKNEEMICIENIRNIMDFIDCEFSDILIDFINSLSRLSVGIADPDNIIYAPAIEWDMDTVEVDNHMETSQRNIFAVGDGAGISQGIVYSSATGIIAGREIVLRYGV